ncbi:F-box DNA helicase 1-like [Ptychodera flava]|uniref:F-box DNA helicase 1-like n=1 Tax=Ptychodera flava TaxID=63121 RepID=UPI00396A567A
MSEQLFFHYIFQGRKYLVDLLTTVEAIYSLFCKDGKKIKNSFIKKFGSFDALREYANDAQDSELLPRIQIVETHGSKIHEYCERIRKRFVTNIKTANVVLTTAHKAKGLEFDTVKLTDDFLNSRESSPNTGDLLEDELNLLYVAMTRAKKRLWMKPALLKTLQEMGVLQDTAIMEW